MPLKPLYKKLIIAGCLLVVFLLMKVTRTSFEDLWHMAQDEIAQTRSDIREYRTGEYAGNVANQLSSEAARIKSQSDRKSTRLNSSHIPLSRMPSSA